MKKLFALFMLATAAGAFGMIENDIFKETHSYEELVAHFGGTETPDLSTENLKRVLLLINDRYRAIQFKIRKDYMETRRPFDGVNEAFNSFNTFEPSITLLGNVVINGEKFLKEREAENKTLRRFWMPIVRFMKKPQGWVTVGVLGLYALAVCLTSPDQRKANNKEGPQVAFGVHHVSTSGGNSW